MNKLLTKGAAAQGGVRAPRTLHRRILIAFGIVVWTLVISGYVLIYLPVERVLVDGAIDGDTEMALFKELRREGKLPLIPNNPPKGTDFVILSGVAPGAFGKRFHFRNFDEQSECWYYMPWWGPVQKNAYRVECTGWYKKGPPELLISGSYVPMDHVPEFLSKDSGYWHEWSTADKPRLHFLKEKPSVFKALPPGTAPTSADGTMIYAFVATTGPNAGKAGAVFTSREGDAR